MKNVYLCGCGYFGPCTEISGNDGELWVRCAFCSRIDQLTKIGSYPLLDKITIHTIGAIFWINGEPYEVLGKGNPANDKGCMVKRVWFLPRWWKKVVRRWQGYAV